MGDASRFAGVLREGRRGAHASVRRGRRPFSFGAFWVLYVALALHGFSPVRGSFCFGDLISWDLKRDLARNCLGFAAPCPRGSDLPSPASVIQSYQQYPPLIRNFWLLSTTFGCESGTVEGKRKMPRTRHCTGSGHLVEVCAGMHRVCGVSLYSSTPSSSFTRSNAAAMALSMS